MNKHSSVNLPSGFALAPFFRDSCRYVRFSIVSGNNG